MPSDSLFGESEKVVVSATSILSERLHMLTIHDLGKNLSRYRLHGNSCLGL